MIGPRTEPYFADTQCQQNNSIDWLIDLDRLYKKIIILIDLIVLLINSFINQINPSINQLINN